MLCKRDCPWLWRICKAPALGGCHSHCPQSFVVLKTHPCHVPRGSPPSFHTACLPHGFLASDSPRGNPMLPTCGSPVSFAYGCIHPSISLIHPKAGWVDSRMPSSSELLLSVMAKLFPATGWLPIAAWLGCTPQQQPSTLYQRRALEVILVPFLQGGRAAYGRCRVKPAGIQ